MKKLLTGLGATGVAVATLATPLVAHAQVTAQNLSGLLQPFIPQSSDVSIPALFIIVFNFILLISGIIAILYLIWAGIQYITASTDEDKAKKAKTAIFNAIIGIVVIILSYAIIFYVSKLVTNTGTALDNSSTLLNADTTGNGTSVLPGQ